MTVRVHVPSPLFDYTGQQSKLTVEANSVDNAMLALDRRFPGLRFRIVDEQDRLRPHIKLFVNSEPTESLTTTLADGDVVHIVAALSGG